MQDGHFVEGHEESHPCDTPPEDRKPKNGFPLGVAFALPVVGDKRGTTEAGEEHRGEPSREIPFLVEVEPADSTLLEIGEEHMQKSQGEHHGERRGEVDPGATTRRFIRGLFG